MSNKNKNNKEVKEIKEYKRIEKAVKQAFKDVDKYISTPKHTSGSNSKSADVKC